MILATQKGGSTVLWLIAKEAAASWSNHKDSRQGAALAYYSVFSLGPIILIAIAVAGFFGKSAIAFYIGKQGLESTYGAAASMIVVLIWVYYTSQIILMGAEVTHAFAKHRGSIKSRGDSGRRASDPVLVAHRRPRDA